MTIYLDVVFFLNLFFDFNLLLTVNNTLKRNSSIKRIFLGSLIGSITTFTLFLEMSTITLFLLKIILSIFMCIVTFGLKDKQYTIQNISYLYMTSTVLGGFLYFLNLTFSESQVGMIFVYDKLSINYLFLVIFSPIMLYIYVKQRKSINHYNQYYPLTIKFINGKKVTLNSYFDTGNKLTDPITHKKVIIVNERMLPKNIKLNYFFVPYNSLNHHGIMKCFKIDYVEIEGNISNKYLIGISESDLLRDGVDCILNEYCKGDII